MYSIPHLETKSDVLDMLEKIKLTQNKQAIRIYIIKFYVFRIF